MKQDKNQKYTESKKFLQDRIERLELENLELKDKLETIKLILNKPSLKELKERERRKLIPEEPMNNLNFRFEASDRLYRSLQGKEQKEETSLESMDNSFSKRNEEIGNEKLINSLSEVKERRKAVFEATRKVRGDTSFQENSEEQEKNFPELIQAPQEDNSNYEKCSVCSVRDESVGFSDRYGNHYCQTHLLELAKKFQ